LHRQFFIQSLEFLLDFEFRKFINAYKKANSNVGHGEVFAASIVAVSLGTLIDWSFSIPPYRSNWLARPLFWHVCFCCKPSAKTRLICAIQ